MQADQEYEPSRWRDQVDRRCAEIRSADTDYGLIKVFKEHLPEIGLEYFAFTSFRFGDQTGETVSIGINNWLPELLANYRYHQPLMQNAVLRRLRNEVLPSAVTREEIIEAETNDDCREIHKAFLDAGLEVVVYVPVRSTHGRNGAVSFSGERQSLADSDLMHLGYIAQHAFERVSANSPPEGHRKPVLNERERECLILTAQGLSSERVGQTLGISSHTVQYHIANICRKLSAVSKIHAVAIALRDQHIVL